MGVGHDSIAKHRPINSAHVPIQNDVGGRISRPMGLTQLFRPYEVFFLTKYNEYNFFLNFRIAIFNV